MVLNYLYHTKLNFCNNMSSPSMFMTTGFRRCYLFNMLQGDHVRITILIYFEGSLI